ncbi:MAG TPA: folylpolyglutamate synthase/dihydrofolate synthase family protein [Bacteroidia bacterium]|nr:folylpolyglutamate synthase/dihydrofolate synthase family protein [Bacteroidia bacterium]
MMNYQQTLDYMYEQLPIFQRIGSAAYKADLTNTIALCKLVKNPEKKFKSIHIAGTNGKGSTSHLIASVLQAQGYKTGLYTSPHLKDFRERIKINGKFISKKYVVDFVEKYKDGFEKIKPSFFEMTVALAFSYFADKQVDIAVIETGLGGRLDSTNVIHPELSIITNISFDHTSLLGNTLEKIAVEKAGIIKPKVPVIIGETQNEIKNIFVEKAKKSHSKIYFSDKKFRAESIAYSTKHQLFNVYRNEKLFLKKVSCELLGSYQHKNLPTVFKAVEVLNENKIAVSEKALLKGISGVVTKTGLLGRWQILARNPFVIADCGHNEAGIKEVLLQIKNTPHKKLHFVIGMVNDKDINSVLALLPKNAIYYFCKANIPRALNEKELQQKAMQFGLKGNAFTTVSEAIKAAKKNASNKDLIFIGGSTFVVAEAI